MIIQLIQNTTLLISLSLLQGLVIRYLKQKSVVYQVFSGLIYGAIAIAGMNMPVALMPGVFYDGRSIVLLMAGLFGGNLTASVAIVLAGGFRFWVGGAGIWAGTASIVISALIGLFFRMRSANKPETYSAWTLLCIGFLTHIAVLFSQFLMPLTLAFEVVGKIWWSFLTIFSVGTMVVGLLLSNDVKRLRTELFVREREQLYRTTLYSIGDAVIMTDVNARVVLMNPVAEQLTGWKEAEARDLDIGEVFNIVKEKSREKAECPVRKVIREGEIVGLANHTILLSKHGAEYSIADSGAPVWSEAGGMKGVVLVFRDMTKEVKRQEELDAQKMLFETMFNAIPDAIIITNTKREIVLANQGMKQTFGYDPLALVGKETDRLYALTETIDAWENAVFNGQKPVGNKLLVTEYKTIDGIVFPGEFFGRKLYNQQGNWIGNLGIIRDITERHQSRRALEKSEERYKYLFENNPMPMWIYDEQNLNFLMVNSAAVEQYGYSKEDFLAMTVNDIQRVEDQDKILPCENEDSLSYSKSLRHIKKNGEVIYVDIISHLVDFEGKTSRLVLAQDISQRVQAMNALKESEFNYRSLFEDHSAVKMILDFEDGAIVNANHADVEFYGWSADELKQMKIHQINILDPERIREEMNGISPKRQMVPFEFTHRMADGSLREVEVFSSLIQYQGKKCLHSIIHDVTGKKETEKRLRLFSRAIQQSPVSIVITDPQGGIEYVNPYFSEVTGFSLDEVLHQTMSIVSSGLHDDRFYRHLWETIASGQNWIGEFRNRKKSGELYWEQEIISPILDKNGKITNYVGIKEDITLRKQMIQDLVEAKEKAEESEQLKSAFLANMSHEIRTPLNVILGFTEILVDDPDLPVDKKHDFSVIINKNAAGLLQIVNDVLDASKLETGQVIIHRTPVLLRSLLLRLYTQYERRLVDEKRAEVALRLLPGFETLTISTDENLLYLIFNKLLGNSVKFTPQGEIVFGISSVDDQRVTFLVSDTGIGISKQAQPTVFERFRQAEVSYTRNYGGAGLGLSISKNLLELMDGSIDLISEEGQGTTFRFTLPLQ